MKTHDEFCNGCMETIEEKSIQSEVPDLNILVLTAISLVSFGIPDRLKSVMCLFRFNSFVSLEHFYGIINII